MWEFFLGMAIHPIYHFIPVSHSIILASHVNPATLVSLNHSIILASRADPVSHPFKYRFKAHVILSHTR